MVTIAENEEGKFVWYHNDSKHGRLGVVSIDENSQILNNLKNDFRNRNEVNYHMSTKALDNEGELIDTLSIFQFEEYPSHVENDDFANKRMEWVQKYFTLLAAIHDKDRREFIPLASFRAHAEGPLIGYYRAIQEMDNQDGKKLLNTHLKKLEKVNWSVNNEGDFQFQIEGNSDEELLESFFVGAWSFWLYTAFLQDSRPMNLFVELDGLLVRYPVLGENRDIIIYIVETLAKLTFPLQMSFTIKSPTLFPLQESLVEHLLIENLNTEDMDWNQIPNFPKLLESQEVVWGYEKTYRQMKMGLAHSK